MVEFFGMGCLILGILLLIALIEVRNQRKVNAIVMKQLHAAEVKCHNFQTAWRLQQELQKLNSHKKMRGASQMNPLNKSDT